MDVVWIPSNTLMSATHAALKEEGADVKERLGFEPLTTITVALGVGILVRSLVRLYKDARFKGVVIDATQKPVQVREMPGWSRRQVLLITAEGPQFIEVGEDEPIGDELGEIMKLLGQE